MAVSTGETEFGEIEVTLTGPCWIVTDLLLSLTPFTSSVSPCVLGVRALKGSVRQTIVV